MRVAQKSGWWIARSRANSTVIDGFRDKVGNEVGAGDPVTIIKAMVLAIVGLMVVVQISPEIETIIGDYAGTNALVIGFLGMAEWIVPVGGIVAVFYLSFSMMKGSSRA